MNSRPRWAESLLLICFLAVAAGASSAAAYVCTRAQTTAGPSLAWAERTVVMKRSGQGAEVGAAAVDEALARSLDEWDRPDCSDMTLELGPPTAGRLAGFDWRAGSDSPENENLIIFRNNTPGDALDRWLFEQEALAITTVTFEPSSGRLLDADIELNDSVEFSACDGCNVAFDLQNTLTHEVGHVLGLDHPPDNEPGRPTMLRAASRGDVDKRDLAQDDIDGLCFIYPAGAPAQECTGDGWREPPDVRFEASMCAGDAGGSSAPVAFLLIVLLRNGKLRWRAGSRNFRTCPHRRA